MLLHATIIEIDGVHEQVFSPLYTYSIDAKLHFIDTKKLRDDVLINRKKLYKKANFYQEGWLKKDGWHLRFQKMTPIANGFYLYGVEYKDVWRYKMRECRLNLTTDTLSCKRVFIQTPTKRLRKVRYRLRLDKSR